MGFGLLQMMSERRIQPASCSANATRQGMPSNDLGGSPAINGQ